MPLPAELLQRLRCPLDHTPLRELSSEEVAKINAGIESGRVHDRFDGVVSVPIEGGLTAAPIGNDLVIDPAAWIYPVRNGIPTLVANEAIRLSETASMS